MGRVDEIRDSAANENVSVPTVLRLCLRHAIDTGDEELKRWVNLELNGYSNSDELPSYRIIRTHSKGNYVGNGYIHKNVTIDTSGLDDGVRERASTLFMQDSIDALMELTKSSDIVQPWSSHDLWHLNRKW